jgi:hypothetical protein
MEFRYLLNSTEIREPVGFDGFKPKIERTDHHGIGVSVSVDKVGFVGNAAEIIQNAYDNDIDTELTFAAQMRKDGGEWTDIYSGVVDLGTYELQTGDEGCRINCNVGEAGIKTTFNNRYDTKVSLMRDTSLDGGGLTGYGNLEREVAFPSKEIIKTDIAKVEENLEYDMSEGIYLGRIDRWFFIPFGYIVTEEHNYFNSDVNFVNITSLNNISPNTLQIPDGSCVFIFKKPEESEISEIKSPNIFKINIQLAFDTELYINSPAGDVNDLGFVYSVYVFHCDENGSVKTILKNKSSFLDFDLGFNGIHANGGIDELLYSGNLSMKYGEKIAVLLYIYSGSSMNGTSSWSINLKWV